MNRDQLKTLWPYLEALKAGKMVTRRSKIPPDYTWSDWFHVEDTLDMTVNEDNELKIVEDEYQPEKWAAERKAFAEGKKIEYRYPFAHDKNDPTPVTMSAWFPISHPKFDSTPSMEFRIAHEQPDRWADVKAAHKARRLVEGRTRPGTNSPWRQWTAVDNPQWTDSDCVQYRALETDRWASVREAQSRGEKVQMRARLATELPWSLWVSWDMPIDASHAADPSLEFRIAPPKKWRPFTADEVPDGRFVTSDMFDGRHAIVGVTDVDVSVGQSWHFRLDRLLEVCKFTDGTPCGVEVEDGQ